ncbi:PQQ-like beta-propeller repeat protein [Stieleria sp. JC731]|uniref:PQQ-binding-like beta-propeller repeat protein n=1 Tax=Pirellulaceae TaxID=2691357 RepID=UPI001E4C4C57|nr:PQQ-binding-like beta-propeller repeat protein [Stieleria sp. JC731]MCC9601772.1 PQQ-like beta-propeller repeat protein [Stieleria sp. JC731]
MKRIKAAAAVVALASCISSTQATSLRAADWPQYRGPNGDGKIAESITQKSDAKLNVQWVTETPLGFSSFAVADGLAFTIIAEGNSEVLLALNADNGNKAWSYPMGSNDYGHDGGNAGARDNRGGDGPRSTPTASAGSVFVYDSNLVLHCVDAKTGQPEWKHNVATEFGGENIKWMNATSPLVDEKLVYVSGGGSGQAFLAFEKSTGELAWKSGSETITHATPVLTSIDGTKQMINFVQSGLVSVDAATGQELWRTKFPFSVSTAASPIVDGNLVYCSAGYSVGAGLFEIVDNKKVNEIWFKPNELMNHWSTPVVYNGHLYGIFEFKKYGRAPLNCVNLKTGEIVWSESGFGPGNCILVGDKLVVLSDAGEVAIVNATTDGYQELARLDALKGKCWSTPAYSNGKIYVRSTEEGACLTIE